ncbi:hypothetical protein BDV32DRAFT_20965 [Aspergillus pseudonomiae]|nr:hypothetical protein BDV32DRAFT_20965 [Aspergillus pseudonomiae]
MGAAIDWRVWGYRVISPSSLLYCLATVTVTEPPDSSTATPPLVCSPLVVTAYASFEPGFSTHTIAVVVLDNPPTSFNSSETPIDATYTRRRTASRGCTITVSLCTDRLPPYATMPTSGSSTMYVPAPSIIPRKLGP